VRDLRFDHAVTVDGLLPGATVDVHIEVVDRAGNVAARQLSVKLPDDEAPPAAVPRLTADSPEEGIVHLTWRRAADDGGIAAYIVRRLDAAGVETRVVGRAWTDDDAPAGRLARYEVAAEDLAGHVGPASEIAVRVLALPHLRHLVVTPGVGTSDRPFTLVVEYRHAGGAMPDRIHARIGDAATDMMRSTSASRWIGCTDWCAYVGAFELAPTTQLRRDTMVTVTAAVENRTAQLSLPAPLVLAGEHAGLLAGDGDAPIPTAGPLLAAAMLIAFALAARRRWP
jgi:hypothetical protein